MPPLGSNLRSATHPDDSILALDLVFVLDTSGSIGNQNFNTVKTLVRKMANAFNIDKASTHMGAIAFGSTVYDISRLTSSSSHLRNAIDQFQYKNGMTYNTGALLEATNMFLSNHRNVSRLKRVLILVTDGQSNLHRIKPAAVVPELARHSIERYVFSVGNCININEIRAIASPPPDRHVFSVSSFTVVATFAEFIGPSNCITLLLSSISLTILFLFYRKNHE